MDYVQELVADLESEELEEPIEYDEREWVSGETPSDLDAVKTLTLQAAQTAEKELHELLWEQTVQQLRAIARRRGWKLHGTRKEGLVNQLVQLYQDAQDTAAAVENALLMAVNMGLAACWVGAFDENKVSEICGLPEYLRPVALIPIGYEK